MKQKSSPGCGGAAGLKPANITVFALALAFGACSADVTRFDSSSFAFDDPPDATSSITKEEDNVYEAPVVRQAPRGPYGAGANEVASEPLAPPPSASSAPSYDSEPYDTAMRTDTSRPAFSRSPKSSSAPERGSMIVVERGDTLYGLSRKHDVSLNDLMQTNDLSNANLRPGQKLYLPSSSVGLARAPEPAAPSFEPAPKVDAATRQAYDGTYTIQPGDSLYQIARANGVKSSELQRVNGITDPRRLRPGQVIKVPGAGSIQTADNDQPTDYEPATVSSGYDDDTDDTNVINRPKRYAARTDTVNDVTPVSKPAPEPKETQVAARTPSSDASETIRQSSGLEKMRWPVMGKVISGFGGRSDGTHNDGVNLAVPLGADVQAADKGVVAYAGSELKGYGNLLLIRHENGWVTAYAHNDELLVKRGDRVRRGQVVAKAGKTGSVDRPQLHFELRKGSKPVDPTPHMEAM